MVGKDSSDYRPRRALPADDEVDLPEQQPVPPQPPAQQPSTPADDHTDGRPEDDDDTAFGFPAYSEAEPDQPKPLYRDEVPGESSFDDRTRIQQPAATPRVRLPDSRHPDEDVLDDLGDIDEDGPRLGQRGRLALLIGAVAAVVVLGLAIGYAVIGRPNGPSANPPSPSNSPSASETSTTGTPEQPRGELLTTEMLVAAADAKPIDGARDWKVSRTLTKTDNNSPKAVCLGIAVEGLPTAREAMIQTVESNGKEPPAILHLASAYGSPEEAAQAYALIAKAIGNCTVKDRGAWLYTARAVTGLGDQSLGVVVKLAGGEQPEYRSLILSRTGRVLNVVDVAKQSDDVPVDKAVRTVAAAVNRQCTAAGGACAKQTADKAGPPPVGDQPGYLSGGDLPTPGDQAGPWFADEPRNLTGPQHDSTCETADLSKVAGGRAVSRTFLVDGDSGDFGLDEYMVTLKSEAEAKKLAKKFVDDWKSCEKRKITPKVEDPAKIKGTGAKDAEINGWVSEIKVPTSNANSRTFRVGVAWVGPKVVYTFLSPTKNLDITEGDWKRVTVRAAERATQVN